MDRRYINIYILFVRSFFCQRDPFLRNARKLKISDEGLHVRRVQKRFIRNSQLNWSSQTEIKSSLNQVIV